MRLDLRAHLGHRRSPHRTVGDVLGLIRELHGIGREHEELERRLRGRGTDDESAIQRRLQNARGERERALDSFDQLVVNDSLDRASARLIAILEAGRRAAAR